MNLIFENSKGQKRTIAKPATKEEAIKEIEKFINEHNIKSYYTRVYTENGLLKFDFGSHTEFFYLEGMSFNEWIK